MRFTKLSQKKTLTGEKNDNYRPKYQWWSIIAVLTIGFIGGASITTVIQEWRKSSIPLTDLPNLEFGSPDYYMNLDGHDFGYEIFNLAALKYYPADTMQNEAYTDDQAAQIFSANGQYEDALGEHIKAIELDPDTSLFLYHKGVTLARMGDYESAEKDFRDS